MPERSMQHLLNFTGLWEIKRYMHVWLFLSVGLCAWNYVSSVHRASCWCRRRLLCAGSACLSLWLYHTRNKHQTLQQGNDKIALKRVLSLHFSDILSFGPYIIRADWAWHKTGSSKLSWHCLINNNKEKMH